MYIGYGVTANIAAFHKTTIAIVRGSSGFDSPYPNDFYKKQDFLDAIEERTLCLGSS